MVAKIITFKLGCEPWPPRSTISIIIMNLAFFWYTKMFYGSRPQE